MVLENEIRNENQNLNSNENENENENQNEIPIKNFNEIENLVGTLKR